MTVSPGSIGHFVCHKEDTPGRETVTAQGLLAHAGCALAEHSLQFPGALECEQAQDVPAVATKLETRTLATTVYRLADADVIELADAQAVNRKAAAANFAGDFAKGVEADSSGSANLKNPDTESVGRPDKPDGTVGLFGWRFGGAA
jgi:hypothetical protein